MKHMIPNLEKLKSLIQQIENKDIPAVQNR